MRDTSFGVMAYRTAGQGQGLATDQSAVEAAWLVLEAANDLGDEPTITACRRVIDASLNGRMAAAHDLDVVVDYFR